MEQGFQEKSLQVVKETEQDCQNQETLQQVTGEKGQVEKKDNSNGGFEDIEEQQKEIINKQSNPTAESLSSSNKLGTCQQLIQDEVDEEREVQTTQQQSIEEQQKIEELNVATMTRNDFSSNNGEQSQGVYCVFNVYLYLQSYNYA